MTFPILPILEHYEGQVPEGVGNRKIRCPFHDDHVKSGSVNLTTQLYNCFGCGLSGSAVDIIMDQEGCSYREAVRLAEELAGQDGGEVSGGTYPDLEFLPSRKRDKPRGRRYVPPWTSN